MIFGQEILDAAVSLWTDIIPRGIMITNMMPVRGIEPVLPTMHCENIAKFTCWIQTLTTHVRMEYFAAGPLDLNIFNFHKAVLVKIPVGGTNLAGSELN
jgi:hypothetical protein